jgi:hypothetical protein
MHRLPCSRLIIVSTHNVRDMGMSCLP